MKRHSAKGLYKKGYWDLGGTLNELDPPSEVPEEDVIECLNFRVHKDGKSREKRPGYSKLLTIPDVSAGDGNGDGGEPALQIHEHTDANNFTNLFAITSKKIKMRKDVIAYSNKYTCGYDGGVNGLVIYDDKLVGFDRDSGGKIRAVHSPGGDTWTTLFTTTYAWSNYATQGPIIFNNNLFFTIYKSGGANNHVIEWNGASFTEHLSTTDAMAYGLVIYNGEIWAITDSVGGADYNRLVHHYNGVSWSVITNYDGASFLKYNKTENPEGDLKHRTTRLFVYKNTLFLIASYYTSGKWTWQVWRFNQSTWDQFNKIYETDDDYVLSSIIEHEGRVYVVGNKLVNADGEGTKVARLYSSNNMTEWTVEGDFATLGFPFGELVLSHRLYLNCLDINDTGYTKVYYYNTLTRLFVLEQTISTNSASSKCSGLVDFLGDLYLAKFKEIHNRIVSDNEWGDIYYFKTPINYPPSKVVFADRLLISTPEDNIMIEGETVQSLGIEPSIDAPTAAAGDAGILTGDYSFVVTFYRRGNYPCESNPSPVSNTLNVTSKKISLTGIPVSTDPKVNARRIYRTKANGAIHYWMADINDNSTVSLPNTNYHDDELGAEVSYECLPPPTGKYYEVWDNRLWIAGNEEHPNLLFFTNTGTAEEYGDNFLAISRREKETINQIKAFGDKLYVFKRSSRFVVEKAGDAYYLVTQLDQRIGTDAPWSVAVCDRFLIWKSEYGIEVFNGDVCFRPIVSELIRRTMASINPERLNRCIGGHNMVDGEYWLNVPTGSNIHPDTNIVFDYLRKKLTLYKFNEALGFVLNQATYAEGLRTLLTTPDGNIHIWADGWKDDTAVVSSNFKTGWLWIAGERATWNILRRMFIKYILPADKTITMKIYRNFKKTAFATISLPGSTPTTIPELRNEIMKKINLGVRGYYIMFEFINNEDTGGECRIIGWDGYFKKRVWKRTVKAD